MVKVMNKSGVSAVVATVLIVMITVAAVGIVWAVIIPMIQNNLGGSVVCNDADVSIGTSQGYTCYDSAQKVLSVQVVKGANNINVSGLNFIISSAGNSISYLTNFSFEKGLSKTFYINTSNLAGVDEISLAPILTDGKKEKECSKVSLDKVPSCNLGEVMSDFYIETSEQRQTRCSSFNSEISCQNAKCNWNIDTNCEGSFSCNDGGSGCNSIYGCDWYYPKYCSYSTDPTKNCYDSSVQGESDCLARGCSWYGYCYGDCLVSDESDCKSRPYCDWLEESSPSGCVGTPVNNCNSAELKDTCLSLNDYLVIPDNYCQWMDRSYCSA